MDLLRHGENPWFTTCAELSVVPENIWDVNGYYRDLGVSPTASRRELGAAYLARDGHSSERLTYVLQQLLNPQVRAAYDRTPLGRLFADRYTTAAATMCVGQRLQIDQADLKKLLEAVDYLPKEVQTDGPGSPTTDYGYYTLGVDEVDPEVLETWRDLLVSSFVRAGKVARLAVGFHCKDQDILIQHLLDHTLILLNPTTPPTPPLADRVTQEFPAYPTYPTEQKATTIVSDEIDYDDFDFTASQGSEYAKQRDKERPRGASLRRVDYFDLKEGQGSAAGQPGIDKLRLLTDHVPLRDLTSPFDVAWITVDVHNQVPTKPKPASLKAESRWPTHFYAVCRKSAPFRKRYGGNCWVCENSKDSKGKALKAPTPRTFALAVRREDVYDIVDEQFQDGGETKTRQVRKLLGTRDRTKEVGTLGDDGKMLPETETVKEYVWIMKPWDGFYDILLGAAFRAGVDDSPNGLNSVIERDFYVQRSGEQLDTSWTFAAGEPNYLADGRKMDLRKIEIIREQYPDMPDLRKIVSDLASDEFFDRWFRVTAEDSKPASSGGSSGPATPQAPQTAPGDGADSSDRVAALKERLLNRGATQTSTPDAAQQPATEAPAAQEQPSQPAEQSAPQPAQGGLLTGPRAL